MLRSTSTVTLLSGGSSRPPGTPSRRANVCRLRLTVPPESPVPQQTEKKIERKDQPPEPSNGEPTRKLPQGVVYGVVRRSDPNQQKEMVVYGWSTNQLKEEMNYIKDVRATLEKVRKRMYGDYDEMRQKIRQLTQDLSVSHAQQNYLESHIQTQSSALDSFNAMNSALASDSIGLQKTLVDVTLENSNIKDQIRNLQQTYEASMDKLREKQRQLEAAQVENQLLKMKVESSQEANAEVMREMTRKLYSQYEEKLQEEQRKHNAEKEALLEETNSFLKAIEEANKKMEAAEISLEERDQKIGELDRLIERMEKERHQLQLQLLEHETEMSGEIADSDKERYQQLEEASASLRERIRHLDDMVHCQQKKVKQMVEEIESLKKKVQQKQLLILQLLEKISFLEGENNELQSRLDYLTETQSKTEVETREIGVGCDLLPRLPTQQNDSPPHCQKGTSPVCSEERRRRDKQHLDDITAARLLPLHHLPAQLLSIEESLALQKQQKQNYEEMQAKLAAQKLAERLNIKMQSYNPEGESSGQYREVRDEDDDQSSEEF
uniref:Myocardial zonula adherens protein n=1 Tax=Nannospalax galili TaxID=1026970 RepID=A0A8C6S5J3_NANGA